MLSATKTLSQLRLRVRRELKDANEHLVNPRRWWTDTELNQYINEWAADLNRQFQLINTSTTITVGSATNIIASPTNMVRVDRAYWNNVRLLPTSRLTMDAQHPRWEMETAQPNQKPSQIITIDKATSWLYPIPGVTGSLRLEGPVVIEMTNDSDVCALPPWMYYSCRLFCAYLAYFRAGPNQDLRKASRYKARYERLKKFYRSLIDARWASYGKSLKLAGPYEGAIIRTGGR